MNSNPPVTGAKSSSRLAPGFRFHPTDEELVGYYLKRYILGRKIPLDAIAEVDLYKREPWDLPALSRLETRDMEWYFFSPLDRKYSNRSRTNRATAGGYWKTTGKDRPIRNGTRSIGMKKTLVFHSGRAPRGERTNWVMHEYRLEDDNLKLSGVPQDGHVVCRIFQKRGAGPQNGAQYGAPFVEEEWEEADDLAMETVNGDGVFAGANIQDFFEENDLLQEAEASVRHENLPLSLKTTDEQDTGSHLAVVLQYQTFGDNANGVTDTPGLLDDPTLANIIGVSTVNLEQFNSSPSQNDGFVELNDFVRTLGLDEDTNEPAEFFSEPPADQNILIDKEECGNPLEVNIEEFFDILNENLDVPQQPVQIPPAVQDVNLQPNDSQLAENVPMFYDAPSHGPFYSQDSFARSNEFFPLEAEPWGFDKVDELMEYFDATDNSLYYNSLGPLGNSENVDCSNFRQANLSIEFDGSSDPPNDASPQASEIDAGLGASSSGTLLAANLSINKDKSFVSEQGFDKNNASDKTFSKRLVHMLGSISAPPAFAAEHPADPVKSLASSSATLSASARRLTAGMIHISSTTVIDGANRWSLQKNGDMSFLLSYGMYDDAKLGKIVCLGPVTKMSNGFLSRMIRCGFYFIFVSTIILAVSCKIGVHIYTR
ncbi:putative transcription factor NAM family [Dioscorea sansibarensis]